MSGQMLSWRSSDDIETLDVNELQGLPVQDVSSDAARDLDVFRSISVVGAALAVKNGPGRVHGWFLTNTSATTLFLRFYDLPAGLVTVGGSPIKMTLAVPGNAADAVAANLMAPMGIKFTQGISVSCTTGVADTDNTGAAANKMIVNILYR